MAYRKTIKIKLQRPILGCRRDEEEVYRLDTCTSSGHLAWALDQAQWAWALKQGAEVLEYDFVDTGCIRLPLTVEIAGVTPYVRNFRDKKGKLCEQQFEAIRSSSTISVPVTVLDVEDGVAYKGDPPTPGQLTAIFGVVGDSVGISPFGSKFGYGRFDVLEEDETGKDDSNGQKQESGTETA